MNILPCLSRFERKVDTYRIGENEIGDSMSWYRDAVDKSDDEDFKKLSQEYRKSKFSVKIAQRKCLHCKGGKVTSLITIRDCEKCNGTGYSTN